MSAFLSGDTSNFPDDRTSGASVDLYAHIEGLCSEEDRILERAEHERTEEEHARLHAIRAELDRVWERLSHRAARRG